MGKKSLLFNCEIIRKVGFNYNHLLILFRIAHPETLGYKIAKKIVLSKIREALGLSRCDLNLSGAAPISPDILKFFMALDVVVTEVSTVRDGF